MLLGTLIVDMATVRSLGRVLAASALAASLAGCSATEVVDVPSSTASTAPHESSSALTTAPDLSSTEADFSGGQVACSGFMDPPAVGPMFLCQDETGRFGSVYVDRPNATTAEEAITAWLEGPSALEQRAGVQGWQLSADAPWMKDSTTFNRSNGLLTMRVSEWRAINNLSTTTGSYTFLTTLMGSAFSDPSVASFVLEIDGKSCPIQIGEGEWCFPLTREGFLEFAVTG